MFRAALIAMLLFPVLPGAFAQTEQQDYTSQLLKLITLTDNKQYREAIDGYRLLQAQPGTPEWLKASGEYAIAELHAELQQTERAITALGEAVRLGFDDCVAPRTSERLRTILQDPKAEQALARMKIAEADLREVAWLKAEVLHARHDGRLMIIENTNRLDGEATAIPQMRAPTGPTTSAAVLYWRQVLLLAQKIQREFVMRADVARIRHATTMGILRGVSPSAALESARKARAVAEWRTLEIRRRAFVAAAPLSHGPRSCSEWSAAAPPPASER